MFIVDIEFTTSLEIVNQYVMEHRAWLDEKYKEGLLLCSGPKEPRTGGVIVALCTNKNAVDNLIKEDPYYNNKIANYKITEFLPNKYHSQIKELI